MSLSPADLFPLSHYANDPEQLIHQLFSVVRGKRLARLIPPELKVWYYLNNIYNIVSFIQLSSS